MFNGLFIYRPHFVHNIIAITHEIIKIMRLTDVLIILHAKSSSSRVIRVRTTDVYRHYYLSHSGS